MSSGLALEAEGAHGGRWKRYPAYRDSGVEWLGDVPERWAVLRLKNVTHFGYGNSLAADDRVPGEYYVYGSNGIVGRHEQPNTKGPCLIIGRKGSFGKVVYSEKSCFVIDTTYFVDSTLTDNNLRWLYYCLQWLQLDSFTKDSAVPGLSREDAYENRVLFCSVDEQRTIAAFLDSETGRIDALIAKKEWQIELLQEKRTALISHAVTKGLDPDAPMKDSGVEWLGEVPEHWTPVAIKRLIEVKDGTHDTPAFISPSNNTFPLITSKDIKGDEILLEEAKHISQDDYAAIMKRSDVTLGDVIMPMIGTIGNPVVVLEQRPFAIKNVALFKTSTGQLNSKYIKYFLVSDVCNTQFDLLSRGGVQEFVSLSVLRNLVVFQMANGEDSDIANSLDTETSCIDTLTTKIQESISKLREYRTALISAAVTGKIDVREELVS